MCEPATIAMVTMAIVAGGQSYMQIQAKNDQAEAMGKSAVLAAEADYEALKLQYEQTNDAANQEKFERMRQGMREQSALQVALGESGINSGITSNVLLDDAMWQSGYDLSIMENNRRNQIDQLQRNGRKIDATAQGRRNEAKSMTVSGLSAGLQIGLSAAEGAASGYTMGKSFGGQAKGAASKAPLTMKT